MLVQENEIVSQDEDDLFLGQGEGVLENDGVELGEQLGHVVICGLEEQFGVRVHIVLDSFLYSKRIFDLLEGQIYI